MPFLLASLILIIPLLEIWILIQIGVAASLNAVFILCVISAGAGWWLMRGEDFSIWTLIETELQNRRLPTEELLSDFLTWSCGMIRIRLASRKDIGDHPWDFKCPVPGFLGRFLDRFSKNKRTERFPVRNRFPGNV